MDLLVIDLDGTITKSDNLIDFSFFMLVNEKKIRFIIAFPLLLLLRLKIISNIKFKIWYSYLIIKNLNINYLDNCVKNFIYSNSFQRDINGDVIKFIDNQKNITKIILSANYSFIAEPITKLLKIETCLSVKLETNKGYYTGIILGQIPYGKEKISVLSNFINDKRFFKTIGIGDSKSDLPILKYLDEGYLVQFIKKKNMTIFLKV